MGPWKPPQIDENQGWGKRQEKVPSVSQSTPTSGRNRVQLPGAQRKLRDAARLNILVTAA